MAVTSRCILSLMVAAYPGSDNGKKEYPIKETIIIMQNMAAPVVTNLLIFCLMTAKKYDAKIDVKTP